MHIKRGLKWRFIFLGFQFITATSAAQELVRATTYGVQPNSEMNAAAIQKTIAVCKSKKSATLLLPGGRIDIWPPGVARRELYISNCTEDDTLSKVKNIAFLFEGCKNITLDGNNTLVVLHGKMISFAIINSNNVTVKNIRFDYARPTISEITVQSVNDNVIETTIHPDSKFAIDSGHISFYGEGWKTRSYFTILFDPVKNIMRYSSFKPFLQSKAIQTTPLAVRFQGDFKNSNYKAGDVLTVRDPYRDNCGAFISLSKNIILDDVKMYFMHGLGIVSQFSENISLFKVIVAPKENSGRIIASFADCFHFSGCRGLVKIDSCLTSGSHDDPINVHGTHLQITAVDGRKIKVRFMHPQTYGFQAFFAGDSIAFINPKTLLPLGVAKLKTAKLINKREMEIEVDEATPAFVNSGLCIENLTWTPEVIIRNSRFERTNTRGLLVTTRRKVIIENNHFFHTGMYPILIADDALSWFESGAVQDVTIRNNVFEECGNNSGSGGINIAPENHELKEGNPVHRNIVIIGNVFIVNEGEVLSARSVDRLVFTGNKIRYTNLLQKNADKPVVYLTACKNVLLERNTFDANVIPAVQISKMNGTDIKTDIGVNIK